MWADIVLPATCPSSGRVSSVLRILASRNGARVASPSPSPATNPFFLLLPKTAARGRYVAAHLFSLPLQNPQSSQHTQAVTKNYTLRARGFVVSSDPSSS